MADDYSTDDDRPMAPWMALGVGAVILALGGLFLAVALILIPIP